MLSILFSYLRSSYSDQATSTEQKVKDANEKIAEYLGRLQESDEPDPIVNRAEPARGACTRLEGVVTTLNKTGGVISHKYEFDSVDAGDQWKKLKIGKKVSVST